MNTPSDVGTMNDERKFGRAAVQAPLVVRRSAFRVPSSSFALRRGMALVVVLVVVALLSLAGYTFAELMLAEHQAADAHGRALQARMFCESGVETALNLLALDATLLRERGGLYDNPAELRGVPIVDGAQAAERGRFSIVAPLYEPDAPTSLRFGLEDESAKLNLNELLAQQEDEAQQQARLMHLPGMTEAVADSILDWLDPDDEPRMLGAEADYYSGLSPPYAPANGPLRTLDELLLVQGVTPELLYGLDANRNGFADPRELNAALPEGVTNDDGAFDRGWSRYLTIYGAEPNLTSAGAPRININGDDLEQLFAELQASEQAASATFIITYRQSGAYTGSRQPSPAPPPAPDFSKPARYKFATLLDLVGAKTSATVDGDVRVLVSPIVDDPLSLGTSLDGLFDALTTDGDPVIRGRVNILQAPREVLSGIAGLTEEQVEQILLLRYPEPTEELAGSNHPTWLISSGVATLDEMKTLLPQMTCRGGVFRAQVIGYFDDAGPAARAEVLIDATSAAPRRLLWKELSHFGRGFDPGTLGALP